VESAARERSIVPGVDPKISGVSAFGNAPDREETWAENIIKI